MMTIKSYIKIFLLVSVLAYFSACKSYSIPYDRNLEGKTISTGLYVCEVPAPYVSFNSSGMGAIVAATKTAIHFGDISKAYREADLREIFYEEFLKNGSTISPKIKTSLKTPAEKMIVINQVEPAKQGDPKLSEYIFEGVPEKLGKDYIFTIKVFEYGMGEGSFSVFSKISYVASIIDMKNNLKIWQMNGDKESSYPMQFTYDTQKDASKVKSNLRDCVVGIVKDVSSDINKVQK